jgi:hypothetical protein
MYARLSRTFAGRYGFLLLLILADYIAISVLSASTVGRVIVHVLLGGTLLLTVLISQTRRIWFSLALLLVVVDLCAVAGLSLIHNPQALGIMSALSVCLVLGAPVAILRNIANGRIVTTNSVLGAACAYLLFGVCFALIFGTVGAFTPGGFFGNEAAGTSNNYLFFSFTTLTTVGYGNLVPVSSVGQSLAMTEALAGQIFLVLVVARLVSLWGQELPRSRRREEAD